jgi:hypothetical protein
MVTGFYLGLDHPPILRAGVGVAQSVFEKGMWLAERGTIAGVELLRRIHKRQFNLRDLRLKDRSTPAVWNAVLAA